MNRPPIWFTAIAIVTALPALNVPWLIDDFAEENRLLLWFYPIVTILASWLAYRCYALDRKEIAWILIVISITSSILIHLL